MIEYSKIKAGDTLTVAGLPHYDGAGKVAVKRGTEVLVDAVHPAGVTVKTKDGAKVSFYFDHGAEKLQYTPDTKKAIAKRAAFDSPEAEAEAALQEQQSAQAPE